MRKPNRKRKHTYLWRTITAGRKQSWRKLAYTSGLALSLDELHYISVVCGGGGSSTHMSCPGFITVCKNTAISRHCRTSFKLYSSHVSALVRLSLHLVRGRYRIRDPLEFTIGEINKSGSAISYFDIYLFTTFILTDIKDLFC